MNVHAESKGENVGQNYDWLLTGQKPVGMNGGSATTPKPKKQKPKPQPAADDADAKKPKAAPDNSDYKMVDGTDLTLTNPKKVAKMRIDDVLAAQGFNGKPMVVSDIDEFTALAKKNGNVGVRSFGGTDDQMDQYEADLKSGDFYVKCDGGNAMGRGMYMAIARDSTGADYGVAFGDSKGYGPRHINMTLDSSAKTITYKELKMMRDNEPSSSPFRNATTWGDDDTAGGDIGAYAAAKGYDAIIQGNGFADTYCVVLNRTKLVVFDQAGDLRDLTDEFSTPSF